MTRIAILGPGDEAALEDVAPDVFDRPVRPELAEEFLEDPRHHLAVAIDLGQVVGFASAVHYLHPDKPPELWINEVGVAPTHRRRGLAKKLMRALFEVGHRLGCREAWVLTDRENGPASRLYASVSGVEASPAAMFAFRLEEIGTEPGV